MTVEAKIKALLERAVVAPIPQEPRHGQGSSVIDQHGQDDIEDLGMAKAGLAAAANAEPTGLPVGHTLEDGETEVQLQGSSEPQSPDEEDLSDDGDLDLGCSASDKAGRADPYPIGDNGGEEDVQTQGNSDEMTPGQPSRKDAYRNMNRALESAGIPKKSQAILREAFEQAVTARVAEEIDNVGEKIVNMIDEAASVKVEDLYENVDQFLNYAVAGWMKENQLAVDSGLKGQMAESLIDGLRGLLGEHSIEVPEQEQMKPLQLAVKTIEQMETQLNDVVKENVSVTSENLTLKRQLIVERVTRSMPLTDAERFAELVEEVEFDAPESFEQHLTKLKDRYFEGKKGLNNPLKESVSHKATAPSQPDEFVQDVVKALSRTHSQNVAGDQGATKSAVL